MMLERIEETWTKFDVKERDESSNNGDHDELVFGKLKGSLDPPCTSRCPKGDLEMTREGSFYPRN